MVAKRKGQQSLAETISEVLHVAPASVDPEDNEDSTARIVQNPLDSDSDEEVIESKFRKQNIDLLENVDKRYLGKKGSRKNLAGSDEEWETDDDSEQKEKIDESENSDDSSDKSDSDEENSDYSQNEDDDSDSPDNVPADDDGIKEVNKTIINTQVQKGVCVRNQLNIWENLLEMRIQLQKCLIEANKIPQSTVLQKELEEKSSEEFISKANETSNNIENLLNKLLDLQSVLTRNDTEKMKHAENSKGGKKHNNTIDDSDADNEDCPSKRQKLENYGNTIRESYESYIPHRNSIIKKWDNSTRVAVIKTNSNPTYSVVNQIENILNNKQKLIQKTQVKRTNIKSDSAVTKDCEYDPEIFDDNDFYHQLLKDLIETKSADVTDPVKLGRQWVELQNTRNKMKRGIDTRATKGRKIRYTVHNKLVNFMAPIDNNLYATEARTELCNSLFGKNSYVHKL